MTRAYWGALELPPQVTEAVLDTKLVELTEKDEQWLRENPRTPWMYESGIPYKREPLGQEKWLPVPAVLAQRWGDCEDLAAWRAAELRVRGDKYRTMQGRTVRTPPERAVAFWVDKRTEPKMKDGQYHIRVRRADGTVEDPSELLGMYGPVEVMRWGFGPTARFQ